MSDYEKMLDLLPYHLQQGPNIQKILKVMGEIEAETDLIVKQVVNIGNLESTGIELDETGKIVDEYRNNQNDILFRYRIATKIVRNISKGDIETLNGLGRVLLGNNFVGFIERWTQSANFSNAGLSLVYDYSDVSFNPKDIIKTALAGGIELDTRLQIYEYAFNDYTEGVTNLVQFPTLIQPL